MSGAPRLLSVAGARLALPLWPSGGRPLRRRGALGLALLILAGLAALFVTGGIGPRGGRSATAAPGRQASTRAAATPAERPPAQAKLAAAIRAPEARPAPDRVVAPSHAAALFARHSWYVPPPVVPPPPPSPPPPPPEPTAPPFPYTFVGSYAPEGDKPVFFLAHGDRVIDAHVGDRLDGVYQFESAAGGQLVFVYTPLNIRQKLVAGVSR
jgi:hypothetical protein